jgi:four helix bundle protein
MKEHRTTNIEHRTSNDGKDVPFAGSGTRPKVFDLEKRLLEFASAVIDISENLPRTRAGNHVAGQLLRSGTSPYSNHGEAESAESPDDFIHKLKVCLKELRETKRWLRLIHRKAWLRTGKELVFGLNEVEELIRIFVASIRTASKNRRLGL